MSELGSMQLPLTPMLQKLKDDRKVAIEFFKKYSKLCEHYDLEIGRNEHGYECVESIYLGDISVPTWNLLKEDTN